MAHARIVFVRVPSHHRRPKCVWSRWDTRPVDSTVDHPPAAIYFYSPDRKAVRPAVHLERFRGVLQVDGYAGMERLTVRRDIVLAARRAHTRRKIDNNLVERAIQPIALGRKNHLFAGSDGGGAHWATVCSLIATAKLNDVEPFAYLTERA